jgi:hypothetical protein
MAFLISDVYSVTPSKGIEWYLYVFDVSEDDPTGTMEGKRVREKMLEIGQELGTSAAIVVGADGTPQRQIMDFLSETLHEDIREAVQLITSGRMALIATRQPLPHTDAMAVIPLSDGSTDFNSPARADQVEVNLRRIVKAIKDGALQSLIEAEDTLRIQQGNFNLPTTDTGVLLLRKANKYLRLKIPLLFAELDVAQVIDDLLGRYPKVNR